MPIIDATTLSSSKSPSQRILGLDLGSKTIGLALSDSRQKIASPLHTIQRTKLKEDVNNIINVIEKYEIGSLVIGLPINMNGTEGERCVETRKFVAEFLLMYDFPIMLWDERLSTKAMTDLLISGNVSRKKRDTLIDKMAAAYILQGVLDYLTLTEEQL